MIPRGPNVVSTYIFFQLFASFFEMAFRKTTGLSTLEGL